MHHGAIADSGITNDLKFSFAADLHIFVEEVILGHTDVRKEHVTVLFCMETQLRTDITTSNSRHPIVICILDLNQEGIDTFRLSIDYGLGKHYSIVGKEGELSRPILGST